MRVVHLQLMRPSPGGEAGQKTSHALSAWVVKQGVGSLAGTQSLSLGAKGRERDAEAFPEC